MAEKHIIQGFGTIDLPKPTETMEQLVERGKAIPFHRLNDNELRELGRLLTQLGNVAYKFNVLDLGALVHLEQRKRQAAGEDAP